jgi:glycosyltransferase 2 family protein
VKHVWRVLPSVLRIAVGIGLLFYLEASGAINWSVFLNLVVAWPTALEGLGLLLATIVLASWRLCLLLRPHNLHLSLWASIKLSLIGTFFNTCLPGAAGGDIIRIYYATEGNAGRRTEVATIMLLDRLVGMFGLLLWPLIVAPLFPQLMASIPMLTVLLWSTAAIAAAMFLGVLLCTIPRIRQSRLLAWLFHHVPLGHHAERVFDTIYTYRHSRGLWGVAVLLSLLIHGCLIWTLLHLVNVTSPTRATWSMVVLIPLGFLANTLPLTPGGLGVGEAAFNRLFALAGFTGGAEALLGWRMLLLLIGLLGLGFYLRGSARFVQGQAVSPAALPHDSPPSSAPASLSWE